VALLVLPIFENIRYKCIRKEEYYKVDIPSGEDKRKASYGNKTQLPCKCQMPDRTGDNSSDGLNDARSVKLINLNSK